MSGSKDRYLEFCRATPVPLHLQPWWLDAVCGPGAWDLVLAGDRGGLPLGALPFFHTRRWGLSVIQVPPLSAYGGPWLLYPDPAMPAYKRLSFAYRTLEALIGQLPRVAWFQQTFRPEIRDILPFHWAGFHQTIRYTHTLPTATKALPALYAGLKNTVRTELRRAEAAVEFVPAEDPERLLQLNAQSYARKGMRQPDFGQAFRRLYRELAIRGQSAGFLALDRQTGVALAGIYLAFDERQASVVLSGMAPAGLHSGALHGLYWEAVRFCAGKGLDLDFEGSMQPGVAHVFRAFGGQLTPYFRVWRAGNRILDLLYRPA